MIFLGLNLKKPVLSFICLLGLSLIFSPTALAKIPHCDPAKTIATEIGRLCTEPEHLVQDIIEILLYIAGGISLLLLLFGGGMYMTSSGNPEKTEEAQKIITAAVSGVMLIFFSIFLLRFIGIDILGIPGLSPVGTGLRTP